MYEELYIIDNGKRLRVDLSIPSGITLNFKSNIFGDLSKITCSYSYTFKLPLTANNRRVFDNADDIRSKSSKIRKKLKAEFIQNGIPLFEDANLYIDSTETCFNAVMTWGVIDGMENLKDNDIALNELPNNLGYAMYSQEFDSVEGFSNDKDYLKPAYYCGIEFITPLLTLMSLPDSARHIYNLRRPLPVVPIYRLIKEINSYFGTKFNICNRYDGSSYNNGIWSETKDDILFTRGVVPLVNAEWTDEQIEHYSSGSSTLGYGNKASCGGKSNLLFFDLNWLFASEYYVSVGHGERFSASYFSALKIKYPGGCEIQFDGRISLKLDGVNGDNPKLIVYRYWNDNNLEEIASFEGKYNSDQYVFDFKESEGGDKFSFHSSGATTSLFGGMIEPEYILGVSHKITGFGDLGNNFKILFKPIPYEIAVDLFQFLVASAKYPLQTVKKLPDISCLEFIKSLFYMTGSFPVPNKDGSVGITYYTDLREHILKGDCIDWSSRLTTDVSSLPNKTVYNISGYARNNYYLTKSDSLDDKKDSKEIKDEYASGIGKIVCDNQVIERSKTIVTIPFKAPFTKSKDSPKVPTGNTFKFWSYSSDGSLTNGTADPICGIIECWPYQLDGADKVNLMGMKCWNGFAEIESNPSYAYLQRIMDNPIVITENLLLNEHDLRHLDYSVPVYLSKYGAYFAIVSITRDSKGISKCELLKLPEEE